MSKACKNCDPYEGDDRVKEDWEATGQEEMNELSDKSKEKSRRVDVADRLENLESLIRICAEALVPIKEPITSDIHFILLIQVINELKTAQKEVWTL